MVLCIVSGVWQMAIGGSWDFQARVVRREVWDQPKVWLAFSDGALHHVLAHTAESPQTRQAPQTPLPQRTYDAVSTGALEHESLALH